jgi:hypothetical protein
MIEWYLFAAQHPAIAHYQAAKVSLDSAIGKLNQGDEAGGDADALQAVISTIAGLRE